MGPTFLSSPDCSAQGQVLHYKRRNQGCSSTEGKSSTENSGTQAAVLPGMIRCGSFPLFSALHSLFRTWRDLKRSEIIPGSPTWRWGEWIWLTGPSRLHQNSPQGLNISCIPITLRPLLEHGNDKRLKLVKNSKLNFLMTTKLHTLLEFLSSTRRKFVSSSFLFHINWVSSNSR